MKQNCSLLFILISFIFTNNINAQNNDIINHEDNDNFVSNLYSFSFGEQKIADTYLSNQIYKGFTYQLEAKHGAYYKNKKLSWYCYDRWKYANLINSSYSALIRYGSINLGFATQYHWKLTPHLKISTGGIIDIFGSIKYQSRNVNNIASSDIQMQLLATTAIDYSWLWNKFAISINYSINTPLIGCMFVPEMGQSYYELYLNLPKGLNDVTHFTSFHNRQGIKGEFAINFVFNKFTLYSGFVHNNQWWHANNLYFNNSELIGRIGTIIDIHLSCGRKSQPNNNILF